MVDQTYTDRYLSAVEKEMQAVVTAPSADMEALYGHLRYHLGWVDENFEPIDGHTGKRIRPILCLLVCEACGGNWEQALPAASAVELLHNFSLIHDDIEDNDKTRRGRPTVWAIWSLSQALNAGDTLYALSNRALLRLIERGVPNEIVITAAQRFTHACVRLTEGQFLDIDFERRETVSPETYLEMVEGKTGELISISCELGTLIANGPASQREQIYIFGHHLGLAFQIQDDILGIWGDPQVTGKPVGADLLHHKKTLPIIYALEQSRALRSLLAQPDLSTADVDRGIQLLEATGSREWTRDQVQKQTRLALTAFDAAQVSGPAATALCDLAHKLTSRTK